MSKRSKISLMTLSLVMVISACSPSSSVQESISEDSQPAELATNTLSPTDPADQVSEETNDNSSADTGPLVATPKWFDIELVNVQNGSTYTINDYSGNVILVETLAMWCSKCLEQQIHVRELHQLLGDRDDFVSVGLDIDPNEVAEALTTYVDRNGFDWVYSIAPPDLSREIGLLYGAQFLNPPSTPMLIIDRNGEIHALPFGIKSSNQLLEYLEPFLNSPS